VKLIGFDITKEHGRVAVYTDGREVWVAPVDAPKDIRTGLPMGLRSAPLGTYMAVKYGIPGTFEPLALGVRSD